VAEYWIIDPEGPSAEIFRRDPGGFGLAARLGSNEALTSSLFPGLSLPLAKLIE
ncbi:MAG: Uma2 family endonuclease, partial [Acidobacteria bacterium]|nr:Uma2 family endonuclease [Acidobacteriota bacterium]